MQKNRETLLRDNEVRKATYQDLQ